MNDFIEFLVKEMIADAERQHKPEKDNITVAARNRAKMNKIMYDAHIEAGFTPEQAIQIVTAIID